MADSSSELPQNSSKVAGSWCPKRTSIHDLPVELLQKILLELRSTTTHNIPCLVVCKAWRSLATSIMWEHLAFAPRQSHIMTQKLALTGSYLQAVRSVSVTLQGVFDTRIPPDVVSMPWGQRTCASVRHVRHYYLDQPPKSLGYLVSRTLLRSGRVSFQRHCTRRTVMIIPPFY